MNRLSFRTLLACALTLTWYLPQSAAATESQAPDHSTLAIPAARPADVASMDAIMVALYDVISGPKGQPRDFNRVRSLFAPGARIIPTRADKNGAIKADVMSIDDFVGMAGPVLEKDGFYEREIHRVAERYGAVAQVFSTYESRHAESDPKPFQRGINSIQLLFDGQRWWVMTIYWQIETPDLPIPAQYDN